MKFEKGAGIEVRKQVQQSMKNRKWEQTESVILPKCRVAVSSLHSRGETALLGNVSAHLYRLSTIKLYLHVNMMNATLDLIGSEFNIILSLWHIQHADF